MTRRTQEQTTHFQKKLQYAARRRVFAIVLCSVILFIVSQYAVTLASNERNAGLHLEQLADSLSAIDAQKIMPNNSTTSMHSDFQKGNRTEVETLTGYVVRAAQELGIEVPTYQFMYKGLTEFPYPAAD